MKRCKPADDSTLGARDSRRHIRGRGIDCIGPAIQQATSLALTREALDPSCCNARQSPVIARHCSAIARNDSASAQLGLRERLRGRRDLPASEKNGDR
jgi:hypothetical protein